MLITNIQRFCLDDGPGIRTTVFFAGCNMRCLWCHNPENFEPIMLGYDQEKCTGCAHCREVCLEGVHMFKDAMHYVRWEKCKNCLRCIDACENEALFQNSRYMSETEVFKEIEKDIHFYKRSSGGVTFSGGEPVLYSSDLQYLLRKCKDNGIHTAIETAGNYQFSLLESLLEFIDLIIIDIKAFSENLHQKLTGQSNRQVLSNIEILNSTHKNIWVRIPVVWNVNITLEEIEKIANFLEGKRIEKTELLPYHKMGIAKYKVYGKNYHIMDAEEPTREQMDACYRILERHHIPLMKEK